MLIRFFSESSAQYACEALLRRLQMQQVRVIFFSLGLLDILMDRCSTPFHKQVANQSFFKQLIAMLNNPDMNADVSRQSFGSKYLTIFETISRFIPDPNLNLSFLFSHIDSNTYRIPRQKVGQ